MPAKSAFSSTYTSYGIFGALGLLDQGSPWGSNMVQVRRGDWSLRAQDQGGGRGFRGEEKTWGPVGGKAP